MRDDDPHLNRPQPPVWEYRPKVCEVQEVEEEEAGVLVQDRLEHLQGVDAVGRRTRQPVGRRARILLLVVLALVAALFAVGIGIHTEDMAGSGVSSVSS